MNTAKTLIAVIVLGAVGAGSYWLGTRSVPATPMHASAEAPTGEAAPKPRKLLYYRNPMGLADTSPTPKKDPMGMDYIAVYEGEDEQTGAPGAAGQIRISTEKVQKLGVRTEAASLRMLGRTVRAAGRVEPDERRVAVVAPRFEGFVEKLLVNATGQSVSRGQPLFETYSPDLVAAQREYLIAAQGLRAMKDAGAEAQGGMRQLAESSLAHLQHWEFTPAQIETLVRTGQPQRTLSFASPVAGVVTEKKALQGMRFMPGEMLYQITDLSSVWVIADLAEQDIGLVRTGATARVSTTAYPQETFAGRITFIYPTLNAQTRTIPVRIELANPGQRLKPAMFAQVELPVGAGEPVLAVPDSAVIDSGTRRIVLVQLAEGRFEPREVRTGARGENYVEVLDGVREGEPVVVAANFLIDAESNLKAVVGGLGAAAAASAPGAAGAGHKGQGKVDGIDAAAGTISLNHGPIASLKWPAMTMDFAVANPSLLAGLKPGAAVDFEFVERKPGEWVITSIVPAAAQGGAVAAQPAAAPAPAAKPAPGGGSHSGH